MQKSQDQGQASQHSSSTGPPTVPWLLPQPHLFTPFPFSCLLLTLTQRGQDNNTSLWLSEPSLRKWQEAGKVRRSHGDSGAHFPTHGRGLLAPPLTRTLSCLHLGWRGAACGRGGARAISCSHQLRAISALTPRTAGHSGDGTVDTPCDRHAPERGAHDTLKPRPARRCPLPAARHPPAPGAKESETPTERATDPRSGTGCRGGSGPARRALRESLGAPAQHRPSPDPLPAGPQSPTPEGPNSGGPRPPDLPGRS